jgi:uncharacterized membrane protein
MDDELKQDLRMIGLRTVLFRCRQGSAATLYCILALAAAACGDLATESQLEAESETPISVTGAYPAEGEQGQTLTVRISGSGFVQGAVATWERGGTPDPGITVYQTVFVSSTELDATIAIALDADVAEYDVAVSRDRKKGIGTEGDRDVAADAFAVKPYDPEGMGWLGTGIWAGSHSTASAINNHGMVAGGGGGGSNSTAAYWTADGAITVFGGDPGHANGINDLGWIVGVRGERDDQLFVDAFIHVDGRTRSLQPLSAPHPSAALAVNDAGTVVGYGSRDWWKDPTWPVVWQRKDDGTYGAPVQLPLRNGETWEVDDHQEGSQATAINSRGDIVGTLRYCEHTPHWCSKRWDVPVLWRVRPDGTYDEPLELGGGHGRALGINDAGWIVGSISDVEANSSFAVLWHPDDYGRAIMLNLDKGLIWKATSINGHGQVIARGWNGNSSRGYLLNLDEEGRIIDVTELEPAPGYTHSTAADINDDGWVVGWSERYQPTNFEATLWRP